MILVFEKILRLFLTILSLTNQYVVLLWVLAACSSLVGLVYTIFSVNKTHKHTYAVKALTSFVVMLIAVGFTVYISTISLKYQSKASEEIYPYNINLVHVGPKAVLLSWSTRAPTRSYVVYRFNSEPGLIAVTDQGLNLSTYHSARLENLKTNTTYRYSIIVDGKEFSTIGGRPLEFVFP